MAGFSGFRSGETNQELEELERMRLLDKKEIRLIVKKRKSFECKIQRRSKCKEYYIQYIQNEMSILKLLKTRRNDGGNQKKCEADICIARRIDKLFKQAIARFQEDAYLWLSYMKFCKYVRAFSCESSVLNRMLNVNGHRPIVWKLAATWEFDENKNIENARQYLMRGLRKHPESRTLYSEAFRMELTYADMKHKQLESKEGEPAAADEGKKAATGAPAATPAAIASTSTATVSTSSPSILEPLLSRSSAAAPEPEPQPQSEPKPDPDPDLDFDFGPMPDPDPVLDADASSETPVPLPYAATICRTGDDLMDQVLEGRLAEVIYDSATKKINNVSFHIRLLGIAKNFKFAEKLQTKIVNGLLIRFPDDELTWNTIARRELEGLRFCTLDQAPSPAPETPPPTGKNSSLKERIQRCCKAFEIGLGKVPTERMWSLYLECMLEVNRDKAHLPNYKRKLLSCAFQGAHDAGLLQEKYYLQWIQLYLRAGRKDNLAVVLREATERFATSVDLWEMRLRFHLQEGHEQAGLAAYKLSVLSLGRDARCTLPLRKMLIQYWQTKSLNKVEHEFRDGINHGVAISTSLKPMFLEWLVLAKDIGEAREVYQRLCRQPPYCLQLHKKMVTIETVQPDIDLDRIRSCLDLACEQFGRNNTEVWMEYVKFELKIGDPNRLPLIHTKAISCLPEQLADNFESEFCLVNTGLLSPFDEPV